MRDKTYHAYLDSHERQLVIHSLALDSSLTPSNSTWWKPVTASQNNQGEALKQSLERYITFHTVENLGAYGIDEITTFNIYCEARGNGSYSIYFLFA